jgi:hypothetical protein
LKCQEAKVKVQEWVKVWEAAVEQGVKEQEAAWAKVWEGVVEQAEWAATDVVEDQEVIASAQNAEKKLSISREFPATQSTAQNAEKK